MALNPACKVFLPMLSPFIDGELPPSDRVNVERHMAACQACAQRVADLRAEAGLIRVGLEIATDEADFSHFAQKVMARITPEKPPLLERLKLSLSELFTYQRGPLVTGLVAASVVALVVPVLLREQHPVGYARERMELQAVSTDSNAHVSPVVFRTDKGDAIIWLVDNPDQGQKVGSQAQPGAQPPPAGDVEDEEEGVRSKSDKKQAAPDKALEPQRPNGGEL